MRVADGLRALGTGIGGGALLYHEHLVLGPLLLVFATVVSVLVKDVQDEGGLASWRTKQRAVTSRRHDDRQRHKCGRAAARTRILREREKQLRIQHRMREARRQ